MARLIVNPASPQAQQMVLKQGVNRLGRGPDNDVIIDDPSVSGSHCEVILSEGTVRLRDLGSTNGTFVNAVRVTEVNLAPGQQIRLGGVPLIFEADPDEAFVAPQHAQTVATSPPASIDSASPPAWRKPGQARDSEALLRGGGPAARPLRIALATAKESPPAVAAPETPAEVEVPSPAFALPPNTPCKYHSRTPARWVCTKCHTPYCDLCVSARTTAAGTQMFCRSCAGQAAPLQVTLEPPKQKSFFTELPRAVVYPFRGAGIMILIVATLIFAALDFVSAGIIGLGLKIIALGYLFSYVQNIINSTAVGEERMPDLPGMDDVFSGFFSLVGVVLMSFGPALVVAYFAIAQEEPAAGIALIPAIIFGCLYFPMAFLAVAIKDTVAASNPLVVVPSILKVPLEYLVTVVLVGGVFAIRWVGDAISGAMGGQALRTDSMAEMFLLFGLRALWAFISVYLLTVTMRILGLLHLTRSDRLGW